MGTGRHEHRPHGDVTRLLNEAGGGDQSAAQQVWSEVYDHLLAIARNIGGRDAIPIRPSDLAHDAFLKVSGGTNWESRQHFFRAFAQAARQCRIDRWRKDKGRLVLTGDTPTLAFKAGELKDIDFLCSEEGEALLTALAELEELDPDQAEVIRLRYIAGMEPGEVAQVLDVSVKTVRRRWLAGTSHLKVRIREQLDGTQR